MYDLKTFWKDFVRTFKSISIYARWGIVAAQLIFGFQIFMVCALAFMLPLAECLLYSFFLPGLAIWIPVLWRKWQRSD